MHLSSEGKIALEDHETPRGKYNPLPYRDSKGVWTQGIGETQGVTAMSPSAPYEEAIAKFEQRLADDFEPAMNKLLEDSPTSQKQFDAMMSLAYNIGITDPDDPEIKEPGRFNRSTVLRLHKAGNYQGAAAAFAMWNKIKVNDKLVVLNGLTARRADEARMYLDGSVADGEGNPADAVERSTQPSAESDKPLMQTRTVNGGTLAAVAGTISVVSQITSGAKDVAANTAGAVKEFDFSDFKMLGIVAAIVAIVGIGYMLYARWQDRQAGLR